MKKLALLLSVTMLVSLAIVFVSAAGINETSTASYATTAPLIDGKIDEIWATTAKQIIACEGENVDITAAYSQILWDETGLYFLAYVEDPSLTDDDVSATNSVSFWVSEMHTRADSYYTDPGDWAYTVSSDSHEVFFQDKEQAQQNRDYEINILDNGYIVEFYMPYLGDTAPEEGRVIGFNATVNDDINNDRVRDGYLFWSMSDTCREYWSKTAALCSVTLVGANGAGAGDDTDQGMQVVGLDAKKWSFNATLAEMDVIKVSGLYEEIFSSDWEGAKFVVSDASDPQIEFNFVKYLRLGGLDELDAADAKIFTLKCKTEGDVDDFEMFYCSGSQVDFSQDNSTTTTDIWTDADGYTYFMFDLTDMWEGKVNFLRFDPEVEEGTVVYVHEMVILDSVEEAYAYGGYESVTTEQTETSAEETTAPEATEQVTEQVTEPTKAGGCKSFVAMGTVVVALLGLGIICTKKKD